MSDHPEHPEPDPNEPKRWLDMPHNVKKLIRWFFIACGGVALLEVLFWIGWPEHKHTHFSFEKIPFFYCLYGFGACVVLVVLAKRLRKILMRDEDYYDH